MRERLRRWWERRVFRFFAYSFFASTSFFIFFLLTFPQHRVRQIVSVQAESALQNRYEVRIADMGFWRLTGVQMKGVQIKERRYGGEESVQDTRQGPPMTIVVDKVAARFSPIKSILKRGAAVSYQVDVGGGILDGTFIQAGQEPQITLNINEVDLRKSTLLASFLGVPLFGVLDGDIELALNPRTGQPHSGQVNLRGQQLTLGATKIRSDKIPVFTELELPTTSFGNLQARINIEPGEGQGGSTVEIQEFRSQGRDINLEAWGDVDLMANGNMRLGVKMRMQVNQDYVTDNNLGFIFNMNEFRSGKVDDWYGFEIGGASGRTRFAGSPSAARGPQAEAAGHVGADSEQE